MYEGCLHCYEEFLTNFYKAEEKEPHKVAQLTFKIGISLNTHLGVIAAQDKVVAVWGWGFFPLNL